MENNIIGADVTGENPLSNGKSGVYLENASGVLIGDSTGTSANVIAFNQQNGIRIISGEQNPISLKTTELSWQKTITIWLREITSAQDPMVQMVQPKTHRQAITGMPNRVF
jgi:D-aminopeptidase